MEEYNIFDATQISRKKWHYFTDNNKNINIFSTPYMYDVWNATPGYKLLSSLLLTEMRKSRVYYQAICKLFSLVF